MITCATPQIRRRKGRAKDCYELSQPDTQGRVSESLMECVTCITNMSVAQHTWTEHCIYDPSNRQYPTLLELFVAIKVQE